MPLFNPGGVALSDIDRLTSITSIPGDTLILTSDGTNEYLTPSLGEFYLVADTDAYIGWSRNQGSLMLRAAGPTIQGFDLFTNVIIGMSTLGTLQLGADGGGEQIEMSAAGTLIRSVNAQFNAPVLLDTGSTFRIADLSADRLVCTDGSEFFDDAVVSSPLSFSGGTLSFSGVLGISNGGTGQTTALAAFNALSPLTTRGDLLTRDASNNIRIAVGAANTLLRSDGTDPNWGKITLLSAFVSDTATGTVARGDIITGQTASPVWTRLAIGASGTILRSDGTDAAWASLTTAGIVPTSRQIIAGAGLTGGGDLSADRTLDVGAGTGITVNANDVAVNTGAAFTWTGLHTFDTQDVRIDSDSLGLVLGEDQDVRIAYDGTNTIFDNLVGTGTFNFDNTIRPITDTVGDIGATTFRFANGFFSSTVRIATTTSTGRLNVATNGSTNAGIRFVIGSSTREDLWTTFDGSFGWTFYAENSANGDLFIRTNNATDRYRFMRDSSRLQIGAALGTVLATEALTVNGLFQASGGCSFNTGGGATDPNNFFKIFKSDGTEGAFHLNPSTSSSGGVGFFTTAISGGILNFQSGLASANKAGASIICQSATDNLVLWFGQSGVFGSGAFGQGWIVENSASGDSVIFSKNGSSTNSTNIYLERANQRVGIGPAYILGTLAPPYALSVNGKMYTDNEIEIDGALNHDGTTVGFFGVAPATRATTYTASNVTTDRAYDANATTLDEVADVLGTLIADLRTYGLVT